jgi:hypothetical protein
MLVGYVHAAREQHHSLDLASRARQQILNNSQPKRAWWFLIRATSTSMSATVGNALVLCWIFFFTKPPSMRMANFPPICSPKKQLTPPTRSAVKRFPSRTNGRGRFLSTGAAKLICDCRSIKKGTLCSQIIATRGYAFHPIWRGMMTISIHPTQPRENNGAIRRALLDWLDPLKGHRHHVKI